MARKAKRTQPQGGARLAPRDDGGVSWRAQVPSIALIFGLALGLRLLAIWTLGALPLSRTPQLDAFEYLVWAERIADTGFYWPAYPEHAPGYPFFLGALLAVFGGSLTAIRVVQAILGAIGCVLTSRIAARTLAPGAALPAGLLQAVYAPLIYLDTAMLPESLFIFLLIVALYLAARDGARTTHWFWTGLAIGAAALVGPTALVLLPAVAIVVLLRTVARSRRGFEVAALVIGTLLITAPVVLHNWRSTGVPWIQAYDGMHLFLGNSPTGDGAARARLGGSLDALDGDASRFAATRAEQNAYFLEKTRAAIGADPGGYVRVLANKLWWATQNEELRDTHSYYFFAGAFPLLRWLPGFGVLLALAAVGVLGLRRATATAPAWLIAYLAGIVVTLLFLVIGTRSRVALVPALAALGGSGFRLLAQWVRARDWRRVAIAAAVFVTVFLLAHLRSDAPSRNLAEEWALTGLSLLTEGNAAEAEAAYRRALDLDPQSSYAWDGLGLVLQRQGEKADSRAALQRAVAINPANAMAWYHLALSFEEERQLADAVSAYRQSLAIAPERTEVLYALGNNLLVQGAFDAAEPLLTKVANRGDGRAYLGLAVIAMQRRDARTALAHAQAAVERMPSFGRAWEMLARASLANGLPDAAEQALINAQRFGADPNVIATLHAAATKLRLSR